jgi:hypothetical protein
MIARFGLLLLGASVLLGQQAAPVKDWKSVRITLARTSCFGSCPAYDVEIRDGVVRYRGGYSTLVQGEHLGTITRKELEQLVEEFRSADYMALKDNYGPMVLDAPQYALSVSIDGVAKTIVHSQSHGGLAPPVRTPLENAVESVSIDGTSSVVVFLERRVAPPGLTALENAVDRLAHTAKWVQGNKETIPALRREGFKFTSPNAPPIIAWAITRGGPETVRELVQTDAPLSAPLRDYNLPPLILAASNRDTEVLRILIEAGASKRDPAVKQQALEEAVRVRNNAAVGLLQAYLLK